MKNRKFTKAVLAVALAAFILVADSTPVMAAGNKAAQITMTYKKGKKNGKLNDCVLNYPSEVMTEMNTLKGITLSETVYIPKTMLAKKGANMNISIFFNLYNEERVYEDGIASKYTISVEAPDKKPVLYFFDNQKKKEAKKAKGVTVKAGTGKYKKYYIVKIKDMPLVSKTSDKKESTNSEKQYYLSPGFCCSSNSYNGKVKFFIDDVVVKQSGNKLISDDFTNPTNAKLMLHYGEDDVTETNLSVVKF